MSQASGSDKLLTEALRAAYEQRDLGRLGPLLADDVHWGDPRTVRGCRTRSDVLATLAGLMAEGVRAEITELTEGTHGILCGLAVTWPAPGRRADDPGLFHVYLVKAGLITEIRACQDRPSAAAAAGVD